VSTQIDTHDLFHCVKCHQNRVLPVEWERKSGGVTYLVLRCPDCHSFFEVNATWDQVKQYDDFLVNEHNNMSAALYDYTNLRAKSDFDFLIYLIQNDYLLPEDFHA